jgi:hypothetical protein
MDAQFSESGTRLLERLYEITVPFDGIQFTCAM